VSGRLNGKRAIIVGASRGIGRMIAQRMAAEGARLAVSARGKEELDSLSREISCDGGEALAIVADCSVAEEATRAVERAHQVLGGLDCVVNVAGIHPKWDRIGDQPIDSWDRTIAVNLSGSFYVCRAALPLLVAGGGGSIVNITSVAAFRAWELVGPYNVSKAGVDMLTRMIAREYGSRGVRANCVAPGVIDAGITDDVLARNPSLRNTMIGMHPMGRLGLSEEVAEATIWLVSDASSFTTGVSLAVDGGFLA
jgi:NAD(P)-dependent dehydrogenase (short-subunit alcohol dehydrogenase family)